MPSTDGSYLLCHICRKWRHIALGTPTLWRGISWAWLSHRHAFSTHPQILLLLNKSLELSASCSLSITLAEVDSKYQLTRKIVEHCARWEHVELYHTGGVASNSLSTTEPGLPLLRSLKVRSWPSPKVSFLAAPLLRKVELGIYRAEVCLSIFPWSQLTVLSVDHIDAMDCRDLINQLASIVYCRLIIMCIETSIEEITSLRDLTLPYLETFIIEYPFVARWKLFDALPLPGLRRLQLSRESALIKPDPIASLASFVSRSGCRLQELCIPGLLNATEQAFRCAPEFSSVVSFIFKPGGELEITEPFLRESNDGGDIELNDDQDLYSNMAVGSPTALYD
ncbi:hypothetical protein DFH06DRAFT_509151 [Mycena polygramma]|nr:hypothetical protein DFH06DRAFT_509151 [Mycena polygramma]